MTDFIPDKYVSYERVELYIYKLMISNLLFINGNTSEIIEEK